MSKNVFRTGLFKDFTGQIRRVTFCASVDTYSDGKIIYIGAAIQAPGDPDNYSLSKVIAQGKASKAKSRIGVIEVLGNSGLLNIKCLDFLLEQELDYFALNPGKYIKGYEKNKQLFESNPTLYKERWNIS